MVRRVTLRQAGGSLTVTIPKDMAEHHHMAVGEEAFVVDTDAGVLITPYDPAFAKAMEAFERGAKKYKNALRELAK